MAIKAGDELDAELRQIAVLSPRVEHARRSQLPHVGAARSCTATWRCWRRRSMVAPGSVGRPAAGSVERFRMEISDGRETESPPVGGALGDRAHAARLRSAARQRSRRPRTRRHGAPVVPRHRGVDAARRKITTRCTSNARERCFPPIRTSCFSAPASVRPTPARRSRAAVRVGGAADRRDARRRIRSGRAARGRGVVSARACRSSRITPKRACATAACSACSGKHAEAAGELRRARRGLDRRGAAVLRRAVSRRGGGGARQPRRGARRLRAGGRAVSAGAVAAARAQPAGAPLRRSRRRAARDRSAVRAARRGDRDARRSVVVVLRRAGARCRRTARGDAAAVLWRSVCQ